MVETPGPQSQGPVAQSVAATYVLLWAQSLGISTFLKIKVWNFDSLSLSSQLVYIGESFLKKIQ